MTTKRHFKKRTLLKKHKKVNLTKKYNKKRLTKTIIKKLVGGAPPFFLKKKIAIMPVVYEHQIVHFWFKGWPDQGVPTDYHKDSKFDLFIKSIYDDYSLYSGNTVIHCSAGVGRSGVVNTILSLLCNQKFIDMMNENKGSESEDLLNNKNNKLIEAILSTIQNGRNKRMWFVQATDQCEFIYNYLYENYMTKSKLNPKLFIPGLIEKYNTIVTTEATTREKTDKYTYDKAECTKNKFATLNRYSNILPYEHSRVILEGKVKGNLKCDTYINASRMEPLGILAATLRGEVILTQCPKPDTQQDFYLMLLENNVNRIVMVTDLVENQKKCDSYIFGGVNDAESKMEDMQGQTATSISFLRLHPPKTPTQSFKLIFEPDTINRDDTHQILIPVSLDLELQRPPVVPSRSANPTGLSVIAKRTNYNPFIRNVYTGDANTTASTASDASAPPTGRQPKVHLQPHPNVNESQREEVNIDTINTNIKQLINSKNKSIPNSQGRVDICSLLKRTETENEKRKGNPFL